MNSSDLLQPWHIGGVPLEETLALIAMAGPAAMVVLLALRGGRASKARPHVESPETCGAAETGAGGDVKEGRWLPRPMTARRPDPGSGAPGRRLLPTGGRAA